MRIRHKFNAANRSSDAIRLDEHATYDESKVEYVFREAADDIASRRISECAVVKSILDMPETSEQLREIPAACKIADSGAPSEIE